MSSVPEKPRRQGIAGLRHLTPARIALGRAGGGLPTPVLQEFQLDHARAREAVWCVVDWAGFQAKLDQIGFSVEMVDSRVRDRADYLRRPDLGRMLSPESQARLDRLPKGADVVIVVADGLSATAIDHHAAALVAMLSAQVTGLGLSLGPVVAARQARVALGDQVAETLQARVLVVLIGERPGLSAADSLGAYVTFAAKTGMPDSQRNCVSNIRDGGLSLAVAGARIVNLIRAMLVQRVSGVALAIEPDAAALSAAVTQIPHSPGETG